jgi:uncharacterized protein with HEPN domain
MSPDDGWLLDMLTHARRARERVEGMTHEQFLADADKQLAVTYLVMIIGEAASQVSAETRALLPGIPWGQIVATRNRIVHRYFNVDLGILWNIVRDDVPDLVAELESRVRADEPA